MANRSSLPELWRGGSLSHPFRELNRLQRRMDRVFDHFFSGTMPSLLNTTRELMEPEEGVFIPPVDVEETDSHYFFTFDMPGIRKENVRIEVRENQLRVSGERKEERKVEKGRVLESERYVGAFIRAFPLPSNVDSDNVEANYENGVLQIALPKVEVAKPKMIPVKEGRAVDAKESKGAEKKTTAA